MTTPELLEHYPPGFEGHPYLYLITLFSLMLSVLLSMEWLHRLAWSFFERPFPVKHPTTVLRAVFALLMVGTLFRIGPDVWVLMRWPAIDQTHRADEAYLGNVMDSISFIWMSGAWLIARLGSPFVQFQLEKQPLPVHLWPTLRQLRRPLYIGIGVFLISLALTFAR